MFNRKQKEINNLNSRCVELARIVRKKNEKLKIERHNNELILRENKKIENENADLRCEIDELKDTIKLINKLMTSNQYDNNQVIRNKIIELTNDWKSNC